MSKREKEEMLMKKNWSKLVLLALPWFLATSGAFLTAAKKSGKAKVRYKKAAGAETDTGSTQMDEFDDDLEGTEMGEDDGGKFDKKELVVSGRTMKFSLAGIDSREQKQRAEFMKEIRKHFLGSKCTYLEIDLGQNGTDGATAINMMVIDLAQILGDYFGQTRFSGHIPVMLGDLVLKEEKEPEQAGRVICSLNDSYYSYLVARAKDEGDVRVTKFTKNGEKILEIIDVSLPSTPSSRARKQTRWVICGVYSTLCLLITWGVTCILSYNAGYRDGRGGV